MKRNMGKAVIEYQKRFGSGHNMRGAFCTGDIYQIWDMSLAKHGLINNCKIDPFLATVQALEAGFWLGYQAGRKSKKPGASAGSPQVRPQNGGPDTEGRSQ